MDQISTERPKGETLEHFRAMESDLIQQVVKIGGTSEGATWYVNGRF
jgi:hypothetical protein